MKKRNIIAAIALLILLLFLIVIDLLTGSLDVSVQDLFQYVVGDAKRENLIWYDGFRLFRIPRVLSAIIAGAALSVSGLLMQALFRNPLAGPYILGISSGAGLGVALAVMGAGLLGFSITQNSFSEIWVVLSAGLGAFAIMLLMMIISLRQRDIMTLLILGVLIGAAVSAIVSVLQYMSHAEELKLFVIWTMGSLSSVSPQELKILTPVVVVGLTIAWLIASNLNLLLLGENSAKSLGLRIQMSRLAIFISVSMLAGSVTAFCGPIGFIGIAVPHFVRSLFRTSDHKILLPFTILTGAGMMVLADILSHAPGKSLILPINAITALLGIPFVVWLIMSKRKGLF
jgi:iron complex transport system permease protein